MLHNFPSNNRASPSTHGKRIGVGALLFYQQDLLIVQPTYSAKWILPGGTVEAEESPLEALSREIKEDLSLSIRSPQLLAVDYMYNLDFKGEYLHFLFSAKPLTQEQAQEIKLQLYQLQDYKFVSLEKALSLLTPCISRRVKSTLDAQENAQGAIYLENGRPLYDPLRLAMAGA